MVLINIEHYILSTQQRKSSDVEFISKLAEQELSFSKKSLAYKLENIPVYIYGDIILNISLQRNLKLKIDFTSIVDKKERKIIMSYLLDDNYTFWEKLT